MIPTPALAALLLWPALCLAPFRWLAGLADRVRWLLALLPRAVGRG